LEADTAKSDSLIAVESNPLNREYYLKDLPLTEEQVEVSDQKILDAYFASAKIYKDGLEDNLQSKETFLTMNQRFPDNEHKLVSYYYLYKIHLDMEWPDEAEFYKNLIIAQYPESDYAKVLADPDYYAKIAAEQNRVNVLYTRTYQDYKAGRYFDVIANSDLAFAQFGDTMDLAPNFAYLKAISIGKIDIVDSLINQLNGIVTKYPNSEVKPLAQNILTTIAQDNPELKEEALEFFTEEELAEEGEEEEDKSPYNINLSSQHMFMIVVNSREIRLNPFKVKLSDYNMKYYSLEELTINSLVLDNEHYLVTVGNFSNSEKAKDYYDAIILSDYVYADLKPGTFHNFVISTENYPVFFKEKDIGDYSGFFKENYLN
jgi:hypothetical protein